MRIIQVKNVDGKWIYMRTVADDQSNRIVRTLNNEGHTARSVKEPTAKPKPSFLKSMSAKPSRMRTETFGMIPGDGKIPALRPSSIAEINEPTDYPTEADIERAVRTLAKPEAKKVEPVLTANQLGAMLKIEGAGRLDDPRRRDSALKIHAATLRVLVARGVVMTGENDTLHLTIPGRRILLGAVAAIVAPSKERRELVAA